MSEPVEPAERAEATPAPEPKEPAHVEGALDRPPFAAHYPRDAELDRLVAYFMRGNHRVIRDEAEKLAERTADPKVAAAVRDLRARIEPAPIARVLLGTTLALLVVLTLWATQRSKELRSAPTPVTPKTVQTIVK